MDVDELRMNLAAVADPDKVDPMSAYMKGQFTFLGVTAALRRGASRQILQAAKSCEPDELLALATMLWNEREREFHYVGMDALRAGAKNLRSSDLAAIRGFILATPWWDTVDSLAVHTVGAMVTNHAGLAEDMDDWIESDNIWIARTAILHQLMYRDQTDTNRLFTYCEMRMHEKDFFIRKALGWSLRQYARTDPEAVVSFVEQHDEDLSALTKREALKNLR